MRVLVLLGWFLLLLPVSASASDDAHHVAGKIEFTHDRETGNINSTNIEAKVALDYDYGPWLAAFTFDGIQEESDNEFIKEYYDFRLKGSYNFENHMYVFVSGRYREDFFGGIFSEVTRTGGVGYHFFADQADYGVDVELGYGERVTRKVNKIKIDYDPGRYVNLLAYYQFTDSDKLNIAFEREGGNDDEFIQKNVDWEHQLNQSFNINFSYESRSLDKPGVGKSPTDVHTAFTLGYKF